MTDILITADELRQWAEPVYDYVRDADGNVTLPSRVYEQLRGDAITAGDQIDLYEFDAAKRTAA